MFYSRKSSYSLEKSSLGKTPNIKHYNTRNINDTSASNGIEAQQSNHITFIPFHGLIYVFLHSFFWQIIAVIIKLLQYIDPCELTLIRNLSLLVAILPFTIYHEKQVLGERKDRLLLLLRSFLGVTGFYLAVMACSYLPLAETSILLSTLPIVTTVMAHVLLKEPYGLVQNICLIMTICGVFLALRIPELLRNRNGVIFNFTYIAGIAAAVGNVLLLALSTIYIRKLKNVHFSIMVLYVGLVGTAETAMLNSIFIPFTLPKCGIDQMLCIFLGISGLISNMYFTTAYQVQPAGLAAVQKSSFDILIVIVFEIIFFNRYPDMYVAFGACFVILSLTIEGVRTWILIMPETSKMRKTLKFLLK